MKYIDELIQREKAELLVVNVIRDNLIDDIDRLEKLNKIIDEHQKERVDNG